MASCALPVEENQIVNTAFARTFRKPSILYSHYSEDHRTSKVDFEFFVLNCRGLRIIVSCATVGEICFEWMEKARDGWFFAGVGLRVKLMTGHYVTCL